MSFCFLQPPAANLRRADKKPGDDRKIVNLLDAKRALYIQKRQFERMSSFNITSPFKYFAFISYSRKDKRAAEWIQKAVENFRYPKHLTLVRPSHEEYVRPIFLDENELEISETNFSKDIERNISDSQYLILLCSGNSKNSPWVKHEIEFFLKTHSNDTSLIIPVILDGRDLDATLDGIFAPYRDIFKMRNLPDMRVGRGESRGKVWKLAAAKILSYMLKIPVKSAYDRYSELSKRAKTAIFLLCFIFAVCAAIFSYLIYTANSDANKAARLALQERERAMSLDREKRAEQIRAKRAIEIAKLLEVESKASAKNIIADIERLTAEKEREKQALARKYETDLKLKEKEAIKAAAEAKAAEERAKALQMELSMREPPRESERDTPGYSPSSTVVRSGNSSMFFQDAREFPDFRDYMLRYSSESAGTGYAFGYMEHIVLRHILGSESAEKISSNFKSGFKRLKSAYPVADETWGRELTAALMENASKRFGINFSGGPAKRENIQDFVRKIMDNGGVILAKTSKIPNEVFLYGYYKRPSSGDFNFYAINHFGERQIIEGSSISECRSAMLKSSRATPDSPGRVTQNMLGDFILNGFASFKYPIADSISNAQKDFIIIDSLSRIALPEYNSANIAVLLKKLGVRDSAKAVANELAEFGLRLREFPINRDEIVSAIRGRSPLYFANPLYLDMENLRQRSKKRTLCRTSAELLSNLKLPIISQDIKSENPRLFAIVGYNKNTQEFAISDMATQNYELLWLTFEEMSALARCNLVKMEKFAGTPQKSDAASANITLKTPKIKVSDRSVEIEGIHAKISYPEYAAKWTAEITDYETMNTFSTSLDYGYYCAIAYFAGEKYAKLVAQEYLENVSGNAGSQRNSRIYGRTLFERHMRELGIRIIFMRSGAYNATFGDPAFPSRQVIAKMLRLGALIFADTRTPSRGNSIIYGSENNPDSYKIFRYFENKKLSAKEIDCLTECLIPEDKFLGWNREKQQKQPLRYVPSNQKDDITLNDFMGFASSNAKSLKGLRLKRDIDAWRYLLVTKYIFKDIDIASFIARHNHSQNFEAREFSEEKIASAGMRCRIFDFEESSAINALRTGLPIMLRLKKCPESEIEKFAQRYKLQSKIAAPYVSRTADGVPSSKTNFFAVGKFGNYFDLMDAEDPDAPILRLSLEELRGLMDGKAYGIFFE